MIRRIVTLFSREIRGLHEAAYLLGMFALFSSVLALFRVRILSGVFGAGEELDLFYAVFYIPDILFFTIALSVSVFVLVPRLSKFNTKKEEHLFISNVVSVFSVVMIIITAIAWITMPLMLNTMFPKIMYGKYGEMFLLMSRLMLLQPLFLGVSNIFSSVTQTYGRYILYAVAPLLYNIGIIIGVLVFYPIYGLVGLVYGVLLGALAHACVQIPFLKKEGFLRLSDIRFSPKEVFLIARDSLPRTIGLSLGRITFLFLAVLASGVGAGAISVFELAFGLNAVPLNIIGSSYSVAAFPALVKLFAKGEMDEFFNNVVSALKHIIFWSLPILTLFIVLRAQIVRVILGTGEFDWTDTRLTAAALALFAFSLAAQSVSLLLVRGYYAVGEVKKPFFINAFSASITIVGAYLFLYIMEISSMWKYFFEILLRVEGIPQTEMLMLPMAFSFAAILNVLLLIWFFSKDFGSLYHALKKLLFHVFAASVVMGAVAHAILILLAPFLPLTTTIGIFLQGAIAGLAGIVSGIIVLLLLGNKEIKEVSQTMHRKFWKKHIATDIEMQQ